MEIILDTSILIRGGYFRSTAVHSFLKTAKLSGANVYLPSVVYDELLGRARNEIHQWSKAFDKASGKLGDMTGKPASRADPDNAFSEYKNWLDETLQRYDVKILSYPRVSHKDIVQASYAGMKPFKPSGEGYKDYLIWHTLLELIRKNRGQEFVFLTGNTRDFCGEKSNPLSLHEDLANQLTNNVRIQIFKDLGLFFNQHLAPHLRKIEDTLDDISQKIKDENIVEDLLMHHSAEGFEDVPLENEVCITNVENVHLASSIIKALGDDEIFVVFKGNADVEIEGCISKSEIYHEREPTISILDSDWNERMMAVSVSHKLPFEIELIIEKESRKITSRDINFPTELDYFN